MAVIYVVVGLIIAVVGGTLIEKMHMEEYVEEFILNANSVDIDSPTLTQKDRLIYAKEQVALFITGRRSLDETDAFVEELKAMGIEEYLQIHADAYDVYLSNQ